MEVLSEGYNALMTQTCLASKTVNLTPAKNGQLQQATTRQDGPFREESSQTGIPGSSKGSSAPSGKPEDRSSSLLQPGIRRQMDNLNGRTKWLPLSYDSSSPAMRTKNGQEEVFLYSWSCHTDLATTRLRGGNCAPVKLVLD